MSPRVILNCLVVSAIVAFVVAYIGTDVYGPYTRIISETSTEVAQPVVQRSSKSYDMRKLGWDKLLTLLESPQGYFSYVLKLFLSLFGTSLLVSYLNVRAT